MSLASRVSRVFGQAEVSGTHHVLLVLRSEKAGSRVLPTCHSSQVSADVHFIENQMIRLSCTRSWTGFRYCINETF